MKTLISLHTIFLLRGFKYDILWLLSNVSSNRGKYKYIVTWLCCYFYILTSGLGGLTSEANSFRIQLMKDQWLLAWSRVAPGEKTPWIASCYLIFLVQAALGNTASRTYHWGQGIKRAEIRKDSLAAFSSSGSIMKKCFKLCHTGQVSLQLVRT